MKAALLLLCGLAACSSETPEPSASATQAATTAATQAAVGDTDAALRDSAAAPPVAPVTGTN